MGCGYVVFIKKKVYELYLSQQLLTKKLQTHTHTHT